jgi:hypothetical protein
MAETSEKKKKYTYNPFRDYMMEDAKNTKNTYRADYARMLISEQENKERIENLEKKRRSDKDYNPYDDYLNEKYERDRGKNLGIFMESINHSLVKYCLMRLVTESIGYMEPRHKRLAESLVVGFIDDNKNDLIGKMGRASDLMSEYALVVEKSAAKIKKKVDKDNSDTWEIDSKEREAFFDTINGIDADDVSFTVQARLSNTMDSFITDNQTAKEEIKSVLTHAQQLAAAKTKGMDEEKAAEIKEAYEKDAKKTIDKIKRTKSLFEVMVTKLSESALKDEDLGKLYLNQYGKLNMESVVEDCRIVYGVMETLNTINMIKDPAGYAESVIGSL